MIGLPTKKSLALILATFLVLHLISDRKNSRFSHDVAEFGADVCKSYRLASSSGGGGSSKVCMSNAFAGVIWALFVRIFNSHLPVPVRITYQIRQSMVYRFLLLFDRQH